MADLDPTAETRPYLLACTTAKTRPVTDRQMEAFGSGCRSARIARDLYRHPLSVLGLFFRGVVTLVILNRVKDVEGSVARVHPVLGRAE